MSLISDFFKKIKKFRPNVKEDEAKKIADCNDNATDDTIISEENKIKDSDSPQERKDKITNIDSSCGKEMTAENLDGSVTDPFPADPCTSDKLRLVTEDISEIMGDGLDTNVPSQEGFVPPPCFEYAQQIMDAVRKDALESKNKSYNPSAVLLDPVVTEMRDFHEVSKYMVTVQDDSEGSKQLMENTANNPKYNQIFMNKDVMDYRDTVFNTQRN